MLSQEQSIGTQRRQYTKNPAIFEAILDVTRYLKEQGGEPTFNRIREELKSTRVITNDSSLRRYLDLLVGSGLLKVRVEETEQPNIRPRHIYSSTSRTKPLVETGERSLLFYGLNWEIHSPSSKKLETDLLGLARSKFTPEMIFASLEDSIVEELKTISRSRPEAVVFATALLSTEKLDLQYLVRRAAEKNILDLVLGILLLIEETFVSVDPDVQDIKTLFEFRHKYEQLRRPSIESVARKNIGRHRLEEARKLASSFLSEGDVLEYAAKQVGISG